MESIIVVCVVTKQMKVNGSHNLKKERQISTGTLNYVIAVFRMKIGKGEMRASFFFFFLGRIAEEGYWLLVTFLYEGARNMIRKLEVAPALNTRGRFWKVQKYEWSEREMRVCSKGGLQYAHIR